MHCGYLYQELRLTFNDNVVMNADGHFEMTFIVGHFERTFIVGLFIRSYDLRSMTMS